MSKFKFKGIAFYKYKSIQTSKLFSFPKRILCLSDLSFSTMSSLLSLLLLALCSSMGAGYPIYQLSYYTKVDTTCAQPAKMGWDWDIAKPCFTFTPTLGATAGTPGTRAITTAYQLPRAASHDL